MTGTLVIGIGNPVRGDDGAGRAVARRLRWSGVEGAVVVESDGDIAALLDAFHGQTRCILVDASHSGLRPGSVQRFDAKLEALPASLGRGSTHALGLADALGLARTLGRLPAEVVVYAIEARSCQLGDPLSGPVRHAVEAVARRILAEIHRSPATPEPPRDC